MAAAAGRPGQRGQRWVAAGGAPDAGSAGSRGGSNAVATPEREGTGRPGAAAAAEAGGAGVAPRALAPELAPDHGSQPEAREEDAVMTDGDRENRDSENPQRPPPQRRRRTTGARTT